MSSITLHPVSTVDFARFTDAFNLAYSDYFTPISMTTTAFAALMERDDLSLEWSVAALDGDRIVGTGLLGIRPPRGWIGGMGVIPTYRRQGIARRMMDYLLRQARSLGLNQIGLEVIEANTGAHTLYRELGFVHLRYLHILERAPQSFPTAESPSVSPIYVDEIGADKALRHYESFHDIPNCWQRSRPSLEGLGNHINGWAALWNGSLVGYALGWANSVGIRLLDLATDPTCDRSTVALTLLAHLHRRYPEAYGSSYNISDDDPHLGALYTAGYRTQFRQIEMIREV